MGRVKRARERPVWEDASGRVPLARLFSMALRSLIDDLHARLDSCGFEDARPAFGFVLLSARGGSLTAKQVAQLSGISKQAATKLLASMEAGNYLRRVESDGDGRERPFALTPRGRRLLAKVEAIYAELESEWARTLGRAGVETLRSSVTEALCARHGGRLPPVRPTL